MIIAILFLIILFIIPKLSRINKRSTYHQYQDYEKVKKKKVIPRLWDPILILLSLQLLPFLVKWKGRTTASPWREAPITGVKVTIAFSHL